MTRQSPPPQDTPPARPRRRPLSLEVRRTEPLTPHMIRVVLGGDRFGEFEPNGFTDAYVKLVFPRDGADPTSPEEWDVLAALPAETRPVLRTYTVRSLDPTAGELVIDFVVHGDQGVAGPWASRARPGDRLHLLGPGGAYAPRPDVGWHLLVGDDAALPAIAASLEAMPPGAPTIALLEVDGPGDELELATRAELSVRWLHRDDPADPELLEATTALTLPDGPGQGFVHGELRTVRALRTHLLSERGFPSDLLSISGYWSRGRSEEGFQEEKAAGNG